MPETAPAIEVRELRKQYGDVEAVRSIDLEVARGEVFGLLGPNGAGKTTTVEILEGYRERTAGDVRVLGLDPGQDWELLRGRVGIVLQSSGLWRQIRVREAVEHWAALAERPRPVDEVLGLVGLTDDAETLARRLSGGRMRRLDFALALVGDPELLFLDEPTTGFDPEARRDSWEVVRSLRELGKTVLLTTHYLDEAQALCDRVAIIQHGRVVALGPPGELGPGGARTIVRWRTVAMGPDAPEQRRELDDPVPLVHELTSAALSDDHGARLLSLSVTQPTLEDVYLELTAGASGGGD